MEKRLTKVGEVKTIKVYHAGMDIFSGNSYFKDEDAFSVKGRICYISTEEYKKYGKEGVVTDAEVMDEGVGFMREDLTQEIILGLTEEIGADKLTYGAAYAMAKDMLLKLSGEMPDEWIKNNAEYLKDLFNKLTE